MPYLGNPAQQRFSSPRAASVYSGDGSTVAFTLEEVVTTDEDILVSVDGVIQEPSVAYAVSSGTTLTFTAAPSSNSGNNIFVYYIARTFGSVSMPDGQNVNAATASFSGAVTAASTLAVTGVTTLSGNVGVGASPNNHGGMTRVLEISGSADVQLALHATSDSLADNARIGEIAFMGGSDSTTPILSAIVGRTSGTSEASGQLSFHTRGSDSGGLPTEQMRIDQNGIVTKPNQPAFLAQPASGQNNIAVGSHVPIVFGTERFDQNADFASNTFTAPVTGKYQLNFSIYLTNVDSASSFYQVRLVTSNRIFSTVFDPDFGQDAVYFNSALALLVDMDAADTAYVDIRQGSGTSQTDIDTDTTFSGYLVA